MDALSWQVPLNQKVKTPLSECYVFAGISCSIQTNAKEILTAARDTFREIAQPSPSPALTMRLWVDAKAQANPPWPQPYFRGLGHLIYAGFDHENSLLLDLRRRRVIGRFSPSMALDAAYWKRAIFPTVAGLMSESLGVTALHCACVERDGMGLLLSGRSGAGKSTLSLAMAQRGFAFISDDWTYFSRSNGQLSAWGLAAPVKLLPDAAHYFDELRRVEPGISLNGELAYEIDPEHVLGVRRSLRAEPRWLVFLERQEKTGYSVARVTPQEATARLEFDLEDLPSELSQVRATQMDVILSLVERECWLLRYGENPWNIARILSQFCGGLTAGEVATARRSEGMFSL